MKISHKLITAFTVIAFLSTASIGITGFQMGQKIIVDDVNKFHLQGARNLMASIDQIMYFYQQDILKLSASSTLQDEKSLPEDIKGQLLRYQKFGGYLALAFFNLDRQSIVTIDTTAIIRQEDMKQFWEDVLLGKVSVGEYLRFEETQQVPVMFFVAPVNDVLGKPKGMVILVADLSKVDTMIDNFSKMEGEYVSLINKEKDIISSSDPEYKEKALQTKMADLQAVRNVLSGKEGVTEEFFPIHQETEIIAFAPEKGFEDFTGNNWSLIVMADKDKLFAPLNLFRNKLISFGVVLFVLAVILGNVLSRTITASLSKIVSVAGKVAKGEIGERVQVSSNDETSYLAEVFNQMLDSVEKSQGELQKADQELKQANTVLEKHLEELERFRKLTVGRELKMVELKKEIEELKKEA